MSVSAEGRRGHLMPRDSSYRQLGAAEPHVLFLYHRVHTINAAHLCMGTGPSTGA